ncbi:dephospho-CoA kinase [Mycoplasma procyoni]|uniref:dephospho-CoA kinase n=1 Tax=Mycoplasma procyoni TaxID=568784 RepID=UPI00197C0E5F|nr:dephospho-CoA kinase [Mycoplasma procyoni]MBN3534618.1 dephospho-CoA kinase [Mycoplasma procyoni]
MIAIIGKYGSGKTTFLKKVETYGYKVLYSDEFYKQSYLTPNESYKLIKEHLGEEFVDSEQVNKEKIRDFLLENPKNRDTLEKLIYPVLERHLESNKYDFVEIPNLFTKNANFERFFSKIVNIVAQDEQREKNIKNKGVNTKISNLNNSLNSLQIGKNVVNISWKMIEKKDFFETFFQTIFNL